MPLLGLMSLIQVHPSVVCVFIDTSASMCCECVFIDTSASMC